MQTTTPTVVRDIVDDNDLRELWIVGREMERPPWFHAGKGGDMRLAKALRVVQDGRVTPNSDGSYTVEGSEGRSYRCDKSCSCPQSQKGPSKHCYHMVSVALYVEWRKRCAPVPPTFTPAPVVICTKRASTMPTPDDDELGNGYPVDDETLPLPLPPVTVDERLAQAAAAARDHVYDPLPTPQEARMTEDDVQYIPEPEEATTAVLEPPGRDTTAATPRPLPGPVLLPSLDARTLEQSMQAWSAQRQVVTRYIKEQMTEGVDYYTLTIKGRVSKATLSKAGSEKFLSLFQLHAAFQQDEATWRMLGSKDGLLCYTCMLMTRSGEVIGEGRGARSVSQDGGDINKAIKMATKSAQVDAILRTGALSDVFTQDLEPDQEPTPAKPTAPAKPSAQDLRRRIWAIVYERSPGATTREAVQAFISLHTGMDLHPDHYSEILEKLREGR
jgi:hypothetical protein